MMCVSPSFPTWMVAIEFDQGKFILDFGGCPVGFQAKVSNIIIQKHK